MHENDAFKIDTQIGITVFLSDDAKEGPLAFKEKRAPNFKMRYSFAGERVEAVQRAAWSGVNFTGIASRPLTKFAGRSGSCVVGGQPQIRQPLQQPRLHQSTARAGPAGYPGRSACRSRMPSGCSDLGEC